MKKIYTTLLLILFFTNAQAQERIVKAFSGMEFTHKNDKCFYSPYNYSTNVHFGLAKITLAKTKFQSKKRFSEWQLSNITLERNQEIRTATNTDIGLTQVVFGEKTSRFGFALAYTYNFLIKEKKKKNQFCLGGGVQFSGSYLDIEPLTSQRFPLFLYSSHFDLLLLPRFTRKLNERFMLDIHIPIVLQRFSLERRTLRSPALPASEQRKICTQYNWKPIVEQIRIGVGVFLDKKNWDEKKALHK